MCSSINYIHVISGVRGPDRGSDQGPPTTKVRSNVSTIEDTQSKDKPKTITIVVNGEPKTVDKKEELAFDEVVDLAFNPRPVGEQIVYEITYWRGHGNKPEGHLVEGGSVKVKDGMVFNVTYTDKS